MCLIQHFTCWLVSSMTPGDEAPLALTNEPASASSEPPKERSPSPPRGEAGMLDVWLANDGTWFFTHAKDEGCSSWVERKGLKFSSLDENGWSWNYPLSFALFGSEVSFLDDVKVFWEPADIRFVCHFESLLQVVILVATAMVVCIGEFSSTIYCSINHCVSALLL